MQARNRQTLQQIQTTWHSRIDPLIHSMGSAFEGLIEHTMTWNQALLSIGRTILDTIMSAIEQMVANWIVNLIVGQTAAQTSNAATAASYAGVAGAAGVASMAGAPFPIDLMAPDFGAAMSMAAAGFATLASAEGGWASVPYDNFPTLLHAQEMVLPATIATPLKSMIAGDDGPWGGRGGGDTHIHNTLNHTANIAGGTPVDIVKAIENNKLGVAKVLNRMARDGHFNGRGR